MPAPRIISTGRTLFGTPGYRAKILHIFGPSVVAYWPQNEAAGTVSRDLSGHAYNGAYTGVTLGAAGIGDGNTAASFDGTPFNNVYSAGLAGAFNPLELTVIAWAKVSAVGVWTDAANREIFHFGADASNMVRIRKRSINNRLDFDYVSGGTTTTAADSAISSVAYICYAITVSKTGDAVKGYENGVQIGATLTGLGIWAGAIVSTASVIGASNNAAGSAWSGSIGPVLLLNRAATAAEILQAATV